MNVTTFDSLVLREATTEAVRRDIKMMNQLQYSMIFDVTDEPFRDIETEEIEQ
jgi:hypothetical protein